MIAKITAALALFVIASCKPDVGVTLSLTDGTSSPIVGARIEREGPTGFVKRILNSVGTFYHPNTIAEVHITDEQGNATLGPLTDGEFYRIHAGANQMIKVHWQDTILTLAADPKSVIAGEQDLESPHEEPIVTNWVYSLWLDENGSIQTLVEPTLQQPLPITPKEKITNQPE